MVKVKLSMVDRVKINSIIPKGGSISDVKKYLAWGDELQMTDDEKKIEESFNQIHDKIQKDKSLNEWYNSKNEFELSDDLFHFLKDKFTEMEYNKAFSISDPIDVIEEILSVNEA